MSILTLIIQSLVEYHGQGQALPLNIPPITFLIMVTWAFDAVMSDVLKGKDREDYW